MGYGDTFGYALYASDIGSNVQVKISVADSVAGGFGSFSFAPIAGVPFWPYKRSDMRHVTGKSGAGKYARLTIASSANGLFTTAGGTFTIHGTPYTVLGAEGERRPANHLK
jgi:hypothetical protein